MLRITWTGLAVALVLLLAPGRTLAEQIKWRTFSYITKMDVKPVGDVEGHMAGTWQRRGMCELSTGEVGVYSSSGTLDGAKGKGTAKGETTCTFADGSKLVNVWTTDFERGPDGLNIYKNGRGEFAPGAGRFEAIKGKFMFDGKAYTPMKDEMKSDVVMDAEGEYTVSRT